MKKKMEIALIMIVVAVMEAAGCMALVAAFLGLDLAGCKVGAVVGWIAGAAGIIFVCLFSQTFRHR